MDNKIYDLLQHYYGLGVKKYSQLWEYARALDYGTDVYMGGGEYCQTQDINNKQKYYELIFNAYNELKDYEQVIKEDYNSLTEREWFCRSEECKAVEAMYYICKVYHDEIEYITDYIGLGQKSGKADVIKNRLSSEWQAKPEPQQKRPKQQQKSQPVRGKGRPKETLKDKMINDADGSKLQKVHTVMNGKKGKDAALIVLACIKKGWMPKPTFTQVAEEFGDIGTQQGFTKYLYEKWFTKDEIEGAINSLD